MTRYLSVNTCKDSPVFIEYLVNNQWKNVTYDYPVSVYVEHIGGPGSIFRVYYLNAYLLENYSSDEGNVRFNGPLLKQVVSNTLSSLGISPVQHIDDFSGNWIDAMEDALQPRGNPPTITFIITLYADLTGIELTNRMQIFIDKWQKSSPNYAVLIPISYSISDSISDIFNYQSIFNLIEETSYIYNFLYIDDFIDSYFKSILKPVGEGTGAGYEETGYHVIYYDEPSIRRILQESLPVGQMHRIKIYSPTFFSELRRILQLVPDFPPFDQWIPDSLFDRKELEDKSNETIQVKISCECPPGCCKICSSKFPYFCCIKYTATKHV